jgi:hypothetical protein
MKRLLTLLPALALVACDNTVEVKIDKPVTSWVAYGEEVVVVYCHPSRYVDFVELLVDSTVVGVDTFPPYSITWSVSGLMQGSVHAVQARATSGSREYLSEPLNATVGYRSRIVTAGAGESLQVYLPNGVRVSAFVPKPGFEPKSPRFARECRSIVFIADRKLYRSTGQAAAVPLDSVANGIYRCDAAPLADMEVYEGVPVATPHLYTSLGPGTRTQLTHDSDFVLIDSSRFTCTANSSPVFSPQGNWVAYYRESRCFVPGDPHEGEVRQDAFVMGSGGESPTNLTPELDNAYFSGFTWTFDGKWVLFRGADSAPTRVLAANLRGRCVELAGLTGAAAALACSPLDSTLLFAGSSGALASTRIRWNDDTLYTVGQQSGLGGSFGESFDWVEYRP